MQVPSLHSRCLQLLGLSLLLFACGTAPQPVSDSQAPGRLDTLALPDTVPTYLLRNKCSGKVLDVVSAEQNNGGIIAQYTANYGGNQRWALQPTDSGYFKIVAKHSSKLLFVSGSGTANGSYLEQWEDFNGNAQQWKLIPVGDGYYKLSPRHAPDKVLDIPQSSLNNGTRVIIYTNTGGCNQQWKIEPGTTAYNSQIVIRNANSTAADAAPAAFTDADGIRHFIGNWQSLDTNLRAVTIRTQEPFIIENSNIRGNSVLVSWKDASGGTYFTKPTIRNTNFYGVNPNIDGKFKEYAIKLDTPTNFVFEYNYIESVGGILVYNYQGTAVDKLSIRYNKAKNIDGRVSNGTGAAGAAGYRSDPDLVTVNPAGGWATTQFFQLSNTPSRTNIEIAWNQVINEPNNSRVEDNINFGLSSGTATSPILVHDNYIQGAYPVNPDTNTAYAGGGILVGDQKTTDPLKNGYAHIYNNQVVSTTNHGINITGGNNTEVYDNRAVSSGRLADGTRIAAQNVGISSYDYSRTGSPVYSNNSFHDNVSGWTKVSSTGSTSNNPYYLPDCGTNGITCTNNPSLGTITVGMEAQELQRWQSKVAAAGVTLGTH